MSNKTGKPIAGPPIPDAPGPRRGDLPWIEIIRPTWEKPVAATLVSLRWRCFNIHWVAVLSRTLPCTGPGCDLCAKIGSHWYAWAVGILHGSKRPCIVEVSEKGWEWGPADLCDQEAIIRGRGIRITRKNRSKTAALVVRSVEPELTSSQLPDPIDPKPYLLRIWGYVESGAFAAPPVPPDGGQQP